MDQVREAARQALAHVQEFKRRWMAVPPFGNKVNKATREAVTLAHMPVLQLEEALRAALEQPARPLCKGIPRRGCNYLAPCDTVCNKCGEIHHHHQMVAQFQAAQQPEQEPVATVAMDVSRAHISWDGKYLGQRPDMKIAMLLKDLPVGTPLYAHPPRRDPLTVTDLQQALVAVDLVDPDAIDDPEGFDNGFTLQQIDALHSRLMQTTPPTTTTQPEPK